MTNVIAPMTCLALLGASLMYGQTKIEQDRANFQPPIVEAKTAKVWVLTNNTTHDVCLITKTRRITAATVQLDVDPTCDGVLAASEHIRIWQEDESGNVSLSDEQGNIITEFSLDDVNGLTSIKTSKEPLSLTPNA